MEIIKADNQANWDNWVIKETRLAPFPQSWEWGDILVSEDKKIERLAVIEGGATLAQAFVLYAELPLGTRYAFCPKGPIIAQSALSQSDKIYELFLDYFKEQGCVFFRVEPSTDNFPPSFVSKKVIDINVATTMLISLEQNEERILENTHKKTRYNIRLAQKKDLTISDHKDFNIFWELSERTAKRDGFRLHDKKHYEAVFASPLARAFTASSAGVNVAAALLFGFGNTLTYIHGASDHVYRPLMAPYLIQWEAIKLAKKLGYKYYDFFGIAPREVASSKYKVASSETVVNGDYAYDPKHKYAGFTRFKLGFNGAIYEEPGTFDLVIRPARYKMYEVFRKIRRAV